MKKQKNKRDLKLLLSALAVLQIFDGILTYIGVSLHYADEGNPVVKFLMEHLGIFGALLVVKVFALSCIFYIHKKKINGRLSSFIVAFNCMYLFVVVSWIMIIFQ